MDFALIAYIVFSIFLIAGGSAQLFQMNRSSAGALYLVGSILLCVFFGMRWFKGDALKSSIVQQTSSWPPILNPCPDYMVKSTDASGNIVCTDKDGYYSLVGSSASNKMIVSAGNSSTPASIKYAPENKTIEAIQILLQQNPSLRWEGIYDGVSQSGRVA